MIKGKPFVKWAGGKRQIIKELLKRVPNEFNTYYEPFVGGGALFFELSPKKAVISDSNKELINIFKCLKDENEYGLMIKELNKHEKNHSKEYYYKVRDIDRDKIKYNKLSTNKKAARAIYLNKACFNGLYRVNSNNEFNVPFNNKLSINTYEGQNLGIIHSYLNFNNISILDLDFENAVKNAIKGDFIYFDPPYDSETETFNSYTKEGFGKDEQIRLSKVFKSLDKKGCYVMLSNHNTKFINELYSGYNIEIVQAKRNINSNGNKRGNVEEVIITNYETKKEI